MRKLIYKNLLIVVLSAVLLAACGSKTTATLQPTVEKQPNAEAQSPTALPASTDIPTEVAPPTEPMVTPEAQAETSSVSFSQDVLPIFSASCERCHGDSRKSAGVVLNSYQAVMAGGRAGAFVIPNDAAGSELVALIISGEMPKNGSKLTDQQIQVITDWINAGAPDN